MKQLITVWVLVFSASILKAQDVITLKSGETINGKVTEVGIAEIRYYKAANTQGPVYVLSKTEIAQVQYQNKTVEVFNNAITYYNGPSPVNNGTNNNQQPNVVLIEQPVPQTVYVERPYYRSNYRPYVIGHGLFDAHISIGGGRHGYSGGHHGGHH